MFLQFQMKLSLLFLSIFTLFVVNNAVDPELILDDVYCDPALSSKPVIRTITDSDRSICSGCSGGICDDIVFFRPGESNKCFIYMKCVVLKTIRPTENQLWLAQKDNPAVIRMDLPYSPTPAPTTPTNEGVKVVIQLFDDGTLDNTNSVKSATIEFIDYGENLPPIFDIQPNSVASVCKFNGFVRGANNFHCGRSDPVADITVPNNLRAVSSYSIQPSGYTIALMSDFGAADPFCSFLNAKITNNLQSANNPGAFCFSDTGNAVCSSFLNGEAARRGRMTIMRPNGKLPC